MHQGAISQGIFILHSIKAVQQSLFIPKPKRLFVESRFLLAHTKPVWAAGPFGHPGHPVDQPPRIRAGSGQPSPYRAAAWDACEHRAAHALWHQQAGSRQICPLPVLGCLFPRDLAALLPPAQMHMPHINKMQPFPPPKTGSPSRW